MEQKHKPDANYEPEFLQVNKNQTVFLLQTLVV